MNSPDEEKIREIMSRVTELLVKKNADYGGAWRQGENVEFKLWVRMDDKLRRLINLIQKGSPQVHESLVDTAMDLVGYAVLYLIYEEEQA
jgi:hypothetical protein